MSEGFDPYEKWLGIAPHERPLHHYRLLGLELFDHDPERIARAADERIAEVRKWQQGRYADLSQQVLTQLSKARVCLLDPKRRDPYDEQLRGQLAASAAVPAAAQPRPSPRAAMPPPAPIDDPAGAGQPPWLVLGAMGGGLALMLLFLVVLVSQSGLFGGGSGEVAIPTPSGPGDPPPTPPVEPTPVDPEQPQPPADPMPAPAPVPADPPDAPQPAPRTTPDDPSAAPSPPAPLPPDEPTPPEAVPTFAGPDAIVADHDGEFAGTTGLMGELMVSGKPTGVLVRYCLGATLEADQLDRLAGEFRYSHPRSAPTPLYSMRLSGQLHVARQTTVVFSQSAIENNRQSLRHANLILDGGTFRAHRVFAKWDGSQLPTARLLLPAGTYQLNWDLLSAPHIEWILRIGADDPDAITIGYLPSELVAAQRATPQGELLFARNMLRKLVGRSTVAKPLIPVLSPMPNGGVAPADPTLPGTQVIVPASLADRSADFTTRQVVKKRYQAKIDDAARSKGHAFLARDLANDAQRIPDGKTRYEVLALALDQAQRSGKLDELEAVMRIYQRYYRVDDLNRWQQETYAPFVDHCDSPNEAAKTAKRFAELALKMLSANDEYEANQWAVQGAVMASKSGVASVEAELQNLRARIAARSARAAQIEAAKKTLAVRSGDSDANYVMGVEAITRGDWRTGLSHFRRSLKHHLDQIVALETQASVAGTDMTTIGDRWWTVSESGECRADRELEFLFKQRACAWYQLALPNLKPDVRKKFQARLDEFAVTFAAEIDNAPTAIVVEALPGVLVRLIDVNGLSPFVGVAQQGGDVTNSLIVNATQFASQRNFPFQATGQWIAQGGVTVEKASKLSLEIASCRMTFDDGQKFEAPNLRRTIDLHLTPGLHTVVIEPLGPIVDFQILDLRVRNRSALGHFPFQRKQELTGAIRYRGQMVPHILIPLNP